MKEQLRTEAEKRNLVYAKNINNEYNITGLIDISKNPPEIYCFCTEEIAKEILDFHAQQLKERGATMFDVEILFYAFRYALGRQTYAVSDVVKKIIMYWNNIDNNTKSKIHKEIKEAIENGRAGMEMDISEWNKILELPL